MAPQNVIRVAPARGFCRKLGGVRARTALPRSRPSALRHWLLLCVVALLGQTGAPALAWCLHDAERGAHLESALTDCADHIQHQQAAGDLPCHDDDGTIAHLMLDAQTPGKVTPAAIAIDAMALPPIELRLSLEDWLPRTLGAIQFDDAVTASPPDPSGIGRLVGHTSHLLI